MAGGSMFGAGAARAGAAAASPARAGLRGLRRLLGGGTDARAAEGAARRAVLAVTGRPGARCGVADYTDKLRAVVAARGIDVDVVRLPGWSLAGLLRIRTRCGRGNGSGSVLHIQYPSLDMGRSPAIGLAPLTIGGARLYLTLHEFTIFGRIRKLYMLPFALSGATVIFSNAYERRAFERFFPLRRCRTQVMPIGSNIAVRAPAPERARALVYFGQIGPQKGLEAFLDVVARLRAAETEHEAVVIGSAPDRACPVFRAVAERAAALGLRLVLDAEPEQVSAELSRARVAFLPFPDGVSEKRGSALACLEHGLAVVTTHSDKTPDWLADATVRHVEAARTAERIRTLLDRPETAVPDLDAPAFRALRWPEIAARHAGLYGFG
jgi:glycosyltransferase involved in cell wall biosynthesis